MGKPTSVPDRIWARIHVTQSCWLWTGRLDQHSYGHVRYLSKHWLVHRLMHSLAIGPIPDGYHVDHTCGVRECVNPDHLRATTPSQNAQNRRGPRAGNQTGVRGVRWRPSQRRYEVSVYANGKSNYGGKFALLEDAERAAIELRGRLMTHADSDTAPQVPREYVRPSRARESVAEAELQAIWTGSCPICEEPLDPLLPYPDPQSKSVDHVRPKSEGGSDEVVNLRWVHLNCNRVRGDRASTPAPGV